MFCIVMGLFFIYIFLMAFFTPHVGDDLKYPLAYNKYLIGEGEFPGIAPWLDGIRVHFLTVNGRSGDKLLIGYLLLPQFIQALLSAVGATMMVLASCRLAFSRISSQIYLSLAFLAAVILLMPWYNTLFVGCMLLNYIIGGGIAMLGLSLFFRPIELKKGNRKLKLFLFLFLGFLAGSWHEGFTFIIAPGLLAYLVFFRKMDKVQAFILLGMILGGIFIISNPGFWYRYEHKMQVFSMSNAISLFNISNIALLSVIAFPIAMSFPKLRKRYSSTDRAIMLTAMLAVIANIFLFVSSLSFPRVMWYGNLVGFVGVGCFLKVFEPKIWLKQSLKFVVIAATIFCIVHEVVCVIWQIRINREFHEVISLYRSSKDGYVFYTQKAAESRPRITFDRPSKHQFEGWRIDQWIPDFYRSPNELLHLTPASLKEFTPSKARKFSDKDSIYIYQGRIVAYLPDTQTSRYRKILKYYKDGQITRANTITHLFIGKDGRQYEYWPIENVDNLRSVNRNTNN